MTSRVECGSVDEVHKVGEISADAILVREAVGSLTLLESWCEGEAYSVRNIQN